jgi:hypothetical protein
MDSNFRFRAFLSLRSSSVFSIPQGHDHVRVPADDLASEIGIGRGPPLAGIPFDRKVLSFDIAQPAQLLRNRLKEGLKEGPCPALASGRLRSQWVGSTRSTHRSVGRLRRSCFAVDKPRLQDNAAAHPAAYAHSPGSGSHQIRRWRKQDSNPRSPSGAAAVGVCLGAISVSAYGADPAVGYSHTVAASLHSAPTGRRSIPSRPIDPPDREPNRLVQRAALVD